jgi:hypothetical protein
MTIADGVRRVQVSTVTKEKDGVTVENLKAFDIAALITKKLQAGRKVTVIVFVK